MRTACQEDADQIFLLDVQLFGDHSLMPGIIGRVIGRGCSQVVEQDQQVVGYTLIDDQQGIPDLLRLGVKAALQGQGVARRLLGSALQRFPDMILTVEPDNIRALSLYRNHGFRSVARYRTGQHVMRVTSCA